MKLNIQALIAGVILALMLLTGCATPKNVVYFQDTKNDQIIDVANPMKITVQPEDKISIVVHSKDPLLANLFNLPLVTSRVGYTTSNTSQLSQQMSVYTVDANGMIDFPVLGKIKVEGKDRHEVADFVKNELINRDLIKDPTVIVEFDNLFVAVLGEVNHPGRYNINRDKITILDVIAMAGDLTIYGDRQNVTVIRDDGTGKEIVYKLDLLSAKEVYSSPAFFLRQNDVIYVEPNNDRIRQSTTNGNTARQASFWVSCGSLLISLAVLISNLVK